MVVIISLKLSRALFFCNANKKSRQVTHPQNKTETRARERERGERREKEKEKEIERDRERKSAVI